MEELHSDNIDGGHEASYGLGHVPGRGRTPTIDKNVIQIGDYKIVQVFSEYVVNKALI
jgi:hypothetical protein